MVFLQPEACLCRSEPVFFLTRAFVSHGVLRHCSPFLCVSMVLYRVFLLQLKGVRWLRSETIGLTESSHALPSNSMSPSLLLHLRLLSVSFLANHSSSLPLSFLPPSSAGIAVGFYGNGETCDGVNRLTYSLRHANRTVTGVQKLVRPKAQTKPTW